MSAVRVCRLDPSAALPARASAGAAGFDLVAISQRPHPLDPSAVVFGTGLAFEIPRHMVGLVYSRSGHGFREALRLSNCVGVIDSDYRGEVMVSLRADGPAPVWPVLGNRVAQIVFVELPTVWLQEVTDLTATQRGTGGLGSTGA